MEFAARDKLEAEAKKPESEKPNARAKRSKQSTGTKKSSPQNNGEEGHEDEAELAAALKTADIEGITTQVIEELESLFDKKTLAVMLGAFAVGYLVGRSR